MKQSFRIGVCLLACVILLGFGLGLISFSGCGARGEVVKDKVLAQLDKVLGELDVKEKEIEIKRRDLSTEMQAVREKKAQSEVRLELLTKKQEASKQDLQKLKQGLEKVQPKIEAARSQGKIELNGKEITVEELNRMATELVSRVKSKGSEIQSQQTNIDALKRSSAFLISQENAAKDMLVKLDAKITEIKDKRIAIDAVRSANAFAGNDSSLTDKLNELSKDVDDMFVDVETSIRVEEEKLADLKNQSMSADILLTDPSSDIESTMSEIDAILGGGDK